MSKASSEKLKRCPLCNQAYFMLEELANPSDDPSETQWRVSCYGCSISTFHASREVALDIYKKFLDNLALIIRGGG
jgi:hypothetical protein